MGYSDHDGVPSSSNPGESSATMVVVFLVRIIGLGLLVAGIALACVIMMEAWAFYKYPDRIEAFAQAVERGSNIDKALSPGKPSTATDQDLETGGSAAMAEAGFDVRLSYFFAWFIVFILVMLLSRIALAAVTTGGRLALYDTEVKRFARALLAEKANMRR
jgi:hypothetical protein